MSLSVKPKDEKPKEEKLNIVAKLEKDQKPLIANNWLEVPGEDDIKNSFNSGVTITWENGVKIRTNKKGRRYRWIGDQWISEATGQVHKFREHGAPFELKFMEPSGNYLTFPSYINRSLRTAMKQFCSQTNLELAGLRFLWDGRRLRGDDTPEELEMEEGDVIEVFQQQDGGGKMGVSRMSLAQ